jgi:hypothetical protein
MKNTAYEMTKFNLWRFGPMGNFLFFLLVAMTLLAITVGAVLAGIPMEQRTMYLHVKNIDSAPVTVEIVYTNECWEGNKPKGEIWENLAPGKTADIWIARIQGHDCDGKQGGFALEFNPGVGAKKIQYFEFDNARHLSKNKASHLANPYPGKLTREPNGDFTYTTYARPKITAKGKAKGNWHLLCQGNCDEEYSTTMENQTTHETTVSDETKTAVSVALEAGIEFEGIGSKTSITSSLEQSIGKSMSRGAMRSQSNTKTKRITRTSEEMRKNNIFAFWQWEASTELSNGEMILMKTDMITCTSNGIAPNYYPGSREDVGSCSGKLANKQSASAGKLPAATTVPSASKRIRSQGSDVDVTNFTLNNDQKTSIRVFWLDGQGKDVAAANSDGRVTPWLAQGESWRVANGAATWQSHWFGIYSRQGFVCSFSPRQGVSVNLSQLTDCKL